jgi:hypothetical protein
MLSITQRKEEEEVDEHAQNRLKLLNRSMIDKATEIVSNNPLEADLWPQFRSVNADYKRRRSEIFESQNLKSKTRGEYLGKQKQKE